MKLFTCDQARAAVSDLLAGDLGMADGRSLEAHLAGCDGCTRAAEVFFWQDRVLAELTAGDRLDTIMGRIRAGIANDTPKAVTDRVRAVRVPRPRWGMAAAAAAIFVVAVVGAIAFLRPTPPATGVAAQPHRQTPAFPAPVAPANEKPVIHDHPEYVPPPPKPRPGPAVAVEQKPRVPDRVEKRPEPPPPKSPDVPNPVKQPARVENKPDGVAPQIDLVKTPTLAVQFGVAYLRGRMARGVNREPRGDELILWTLIHSGVPESDPDVQRLLTSMLERKLEKTYNVALQAMILEDLDRVKHQGRIAQCAQFLVDNQAKNGQWGYGEPSIFVESVAVATKPAVAPAKAQKAVKEFPAAGSRGPKPEVKTFVRIRKMRPGPEGGDNSNTMYAALGLRACADAGIELDRAVLQLAYEWWRRAQVRESKTPAYGGEGWCYGGHDHGHRGYGSMTAGGVGSLVIYNYLLNRDWTRDQNVKNGMDWLAKNFTVTENPGPSEHGGRPGAALYYYLYALERAGILYGTEKIGRHEWYPRGVEMLLENQQTTGAWASRDGGNEIHDTCFAILFLRRAVPALPPPVATK